MAPSLTKLGRFELIERIGVGGFGSVWKARDKELDRTVAIKIPRAVGMTPEQQEKFFREARAAAQLRHPSIVSVHEVGRDGDSVYIVSDFVRGVTLGDWLTGQKLTSREAAELCAKVADALHHAHEQGVVHRDLKPANIMIDYDGEPHLMDFGLARRESGEVTVTVDGQLLGTPAYMSPEQAQGEAHAADRRSDVYSLGVILFQLLTGELPFRGNARMLVKQVIHDEPPSPRKLNGNVAKDLETITLKCLEKEPNRRFQSARDVARELRRYLSGEPIEARPIGRPERLIRLVRRHKLVSFFASAAALALLAGTIVSLYFALDAARHANIANSRAAEAITAKQEADNARRNAEAVTDFLVRSFESVNPYQAGRMISGGELLERAEQRLNEDLASQPLARAAILDAIGRSWIGLGDWDKGISSLEEANQLMLQALGPEDLRTLRTQSNLADAHAYSGARTKPIELYEAVLHKLNSTYGVDAPETLAVMDSLGRAYQASSQVEKAISIHRQTFKVHRDTLGTDAPATLRSMDLLGNALTSAGFVDEAIEIHKKALAVRRSKLGEDHFDTISSMDNLGLAYRRSRRLKEAIPLYERVVSAMKTKLGDRHTDTLLTMNHLGMAYWLTRQNEAAIKIQEHCLAAWSEKETTNGVNALVAKSNLASAYADSGRVDDAIRLHEEVFAVRRNYRTDVRKFNTMHGLAYAYHLAGRYAAAAEVAFQAFNGRLDRRGPTNLQSLTSLHNSLASTYAAGKMSEPARLAYFDYALFFRALAQVKSTKPELAKSADIVDDMESLLPDLDPELLTSLPLESDQQTQAIVSSVISRGDVSDFMYVVAARSLTSPKNPDVASQLLTVVVANCRRDDGSYDFGNASSWERAAAYFLGFLPEDHYLRNTPKNQLAAFPWFCVAQRREVDGSSDDAIAKYARCIELSSDDESAVIGQLAKWRLSKMYASKKTGQK
jgi:serine/threonine protein kinase